MIASPNTVDGARGHDHGHDREDEEVDRQPEEVADLHRPLALREAGEVAEIEQQRGEVGDDQDGRVRHRAEGLDAAVLVVRRA